jgi:DNA-binding MarR family transcriptional regulator
MSKSSSGSSNSYPEKLRLVNQVCFPLYSASNAVIRSYKPYLKELDLTYLQYIVLMVLWEKEKLNVKEIGGKLMLNSGTLTPVLKRLDSKGYIERRRSEKDERARIIILTKKGKELQKSAESIPFQLLNSMGLSKKQLQQMKELCEQVLSILD